MMFTKKRRLIVLLLWTGFLSLIYFSLGYTEFYLPVMTSYAIFCFVLSVLYVLVNGGLRPILDEDRKREAKSRKQYLLDKGKSHPIKRKDKYRRFRIVEEEKEKEEPKEKLPTPNPLHIREELRPLISQILLVTVLPFYLIFLFDWLIVTIFA